MPAWRRIGALSIWEAGRVVRVNNATVRLTRAEMAVLALLIQAAPAPVHRAMLAQAARLHPNGGSSRLADQRIYTLRRKLGDTGRKSTVIVSVAGIGYALDL